jgi:hypothetical protein
MIKISVKLVFHDNYGMKKNIICEKREREMVFIALSLHCELKFLFLTRSRVSYDSTKKFSMASIYDYCTISRTGYAISSNV